MIRVFTHNYLLFIVKTRYTIFFGVARGSYNLTITIDHQSIID